MTDAVGNVTTETYSQTVVGTIVTWVRKVTRPSGRYIQYNGHFCLGCDPDPNLTATDGVSTWQYNIVPDPGTGAFVTATITDPLSHVRVVVSDVASGLPLSETLDVGSGHLNLQTTYTNNTANITSVTYPEGNKTIYSYDAGQNLVEVRQIAKPGSSLADIVSSAIYPSCSPTNFRICRKPTSVTDANGNETDYTYDPAHGGMLTATYPTVGGGQPQTRYAYSAMYAWYKNSSGVIVSATSSVYKQTQVSQCRSGNGIVGAQWGAVTWNAFNWSAASCLGTPQETRTANTYPTGSSSLATNLLPSSVTSGAGDGSVTTTVSSTYDIASNLAATSGPISGDNKAFFYNANRQQVGAINPDPDGGGPLKNPAVRTTYDSDGRASEVEQGTTTGESATDFASFVSLNQRTTSYDSVTGAKIQDTAYVGGLSHPISATNYSYDGARNLTCTAVRENSAVFGSLPSACNQSTNGSFGPDQITQNNYDDANRLISVISGYNTSGVTPIATVSNTYTQNSKLDYIDDAKGCRSDYTYDGQDRLVRLAFPSKVMCNTPSSTEYEVYAYDANGNRTSVTLRSGHIISYSYDALNRQILKHFSSGPSTDVYYGYDLLGNMLFAHYSSTGGAGIEYAYDALGRTTSETEYGRTVASQYDLAGNRTRLTYPDSNYIQYTYDILNRMLQLQQNGSTVLAQYSYDDLSREIGINRSNSTTTTMSYSSTSQDWSLAHTGLSQNVTFGMNFTPAIQIWQRSVSNTAYAYSAPAASKTYTPNGMNEYDSVGSAPYTYDERGNLISDGSRTLSYDLENHLLGVSGSPSTTLGYDPLGRMQQTVSSGTKQYLYDGNSLIVEYDGSGNALRRYVPGQGADETLVWYEGSNLSTPNWLHTDQQGSVIAASNSSAIATIYAYSVSGEPAGGWSGAPPIFRYTGQAALPAIALYYYKARMYDPTLGRFLQTDPVGYDAGLNLYAYAGNDPANVGDPSGRTPICYQYSGTDTVNGQTFTYPATFNFCDQQKEDAQTKDDKFQQPAVVAHPQDAQRRTNSRPSGTNGNTICPGASSGGTAVDNGKGSTYLPGQAPGSIIKFSLNGGGGALGFGLGYSSGSYYYSGSNGTSYQGNFYAYHGYFGLYASAGKEGGVSNSLNTFFGPSFGGTAAVGPGGVSVSGNPSGLSGGLGIGPGGGAAADFSYALPSGCPVPRH